MRSVICVHERYEAHWPFVANYWHERWSKVGDCDLYRSEDPDPRAAEMVKDPANVQRLVLLGIPVSDAELEPFAALEECYATGPYGDDAREGLNRATERGVCFIEARGDVQWGQTVAEFALGLTICALRRIPQTYAAMIDRHEPWHYVPEMGKPGRRGAQFGDDINFANGTIAGKRVRVIGAGNIGGRYAKWCSMLGAGVSVWDPFAPDATFAAAGVERCFHLDQLVTDAEIFAPMVPLTESTRGLVTAAHINALPNRALVVQVTRARVCDTEALYRRVLKNELSLAADVFDSEPVALDSPLLGRHNVVHTPHNAGRTIDANHARADDAIARFRPR